MSNSFNVLFRCSFLIKYGIAASILFIFWFQLSSLRKNANSEESTEFMFYESITNITYNLPKNISDVKSYIAKYNFGEKIYNEEIFGPLGEGSLIVVVQVHNGINHLRHLIESLKQARDISKTLLIFSHDYYGDDINDLVQDIDFCKVMQMFYPYSIQVYPNQYPGDDPNDCPKYATKEEALERNCNNADYPDLYGYYREAEFAQMKHHWWWKTNRVFDQLKVTRNYKGLVLFLEEYQYIAEDFIHVLKLMDEKRKNSCKICSIFSLGSFVKLNKEATAIKTRWVGNKYNMGMAFDYLTWAKIKNCSDYFCTYDDYNWDWSLRYTFRNCFKKDVNVMVLEQGRIFDLGACDSHQRNNDCDSIISKIKEELKSAHTFLYPKRLELINGKDGDNKIAKENGRWGDVRDHRLCFNMTSSSYI